MKTKLSIEAKFLTSLLKKGESIRLEHEVLETGSLVRLTRVGLGMTQRQLAKRAKISQPMIARVEKNLVKPNEETLRKIFAAMECDIAIVPVPRFKNIEELLREKAKKIAEKRLQYLDGTMALEKQLPEKKWREGLVENEIESLLNKPTQLWDEDAS